MCLRDFFACAKYLIALTARSACLLIEEPDFGSDPQIAARVVIGGVCARQAGPDLFIYEFLQVLRQLNVIFTGLKALVRIIREREFCLEEALTAWWVVPWSTSPSETSDRSRGGSVPRFRQAALYRGIRSLRSCTSPSFATSGFTLSEAGSS